MLVWHVDEICIKFSISVNYESFKLAGVKLKDYFDLRISLGYVFIVAG